MVYTIIGAPHPEIFRPVAILPHRSQDDMARVWLLKNRPGSLIRERVGCEACHHPTTVRAGAPPPQVSDAKVGIVTWRAQTVPMPIVGDTGRTEVNVVPCDFVVDAIVHLSALPGAVGKVSITQCAAGKALLIVSCFTGAIRARLGLKGLV
eukprot:9428293-Pyramimonas_sp.AAC.1